jgi:hypothetical protein
MNGLLKPDMGKLVYLAAGFFLVPAVIKMARR